MLEKVENVEVVSGGKMGLQVENRKHISLKDETVNESHGSVRGLRQENQVELCADKNRQMCRGQGG